MANLYKNRVVYGEEVLMDITDTTADEHSVLSGEVFYNRSGARTIGTLGLVTQSTNGLMSAVDKAKLDGINIQCKTTAEWNSTPTYIPQLGEIIIYSDNGTIYNDLDEPISVPNIKIGDGQAYGIDLPFITDAVRNQILISLTNHINDTTVHVTAADKTKWNNKLNCDISGEELTFNRN